MSAALPPRAVVYARFKRRRTATSVMAGDFDPRPHRDVLTSLLNGVPRYKEVEKDEEERRVRRREKKEREREKKRALKLAMKKDLPVARAASNPAVAASISGASTPVRASPAVNHSTSSFWRTRGPALNAPRSVSPSPPPEADSPPTPGPSVSSTVSVTSSKRPYTPDDGLWLSDDMLMSPPGEMSRKIRRKRSAARKGWKGWVEGSPPPSDKLINLDKAPVMVERRLRSGKNFDAIGEGQDTWVDPGAQLDQVPQSRSF